MVRIENWSCVADPDPYKAPELRKTRLVGQVYGHKHHADGTRVTTSSIVSMLSNRVQTSSGTCYVLGEPDPKYSAYRETIGQPIDMAKESVG